MNAADLSVAWIGRNPKIDYVWKSADPTVEGWPAVGSTVTWVANVRSLGTESLQGVAYRWLIDGVVVKSGTLDFPPQSLVQAELPWTWTFARHETGRMELRSCRFPTAARHGLRIWSRST